MNRRYILLIIGLLLLPDFAHSTSIDSDQDGLTDDREAYFYTDPLDIDTDNDGYSDFVEITHDYSPHRVRGIRLHENDYDNDGLNDWLERWFGSDLGKQDTDNDGLTDFDEVMSGKSPLPNVTTTFSRLIEVDRTKQRLYYYVDGVKIINMPVSTGNPDKETPAGEFIINYMTETKRYIGDDYDLPNVKWNMQFLPAFYIHGAYWHNDFGIKTHSHGCVNMRNKDAEILYKYMELGVPVHIIGDTPSKYWVGT